MNQIFPVKIASDGRSLLNIGCGSRTHSSWNNVDFSQLIFFVRYPKIANFFFKIHLLSKDRYERSLNVDPNILHYNLNRGIPFENDVFDVIYHSHVLEHFDFDFAKYILLECYRCLKPGGLLRVVVPDLHFLVSEYLNTYNNLSEDHSIDLSSHSKSIYNLLHQMVITEPAATKEQNLLVRFLEHAIRGDAARSGELHRWMYDRYSLRGILSDTGFTNISYMEYDSSSINNWNDFRLDMNSNGGPHISHSLYIEGIK